MGSKHLRKTSTNQKDVSYANRKQRESLLIEGTLLIISFLIVKVVSSRWDGVQDRRFAGARQAGELAPGTFTGRCQGAIFEVLGINNSL